MLAYSRTTALTLSLLVMLLTPTPTKASRPTWKGVEIHRFAQSSSKPLLILAIGQGILYRSKDGGQSWIPLRVPTRNGLTINWAHIDPVDHRRLLVLARDQTASRNHLFYESEDEGKTWKSLAPTTIQLPKPFPDSTVTLQLLLRGTKPTDSIPALIDTGYSIDEEVVQTGSKSYFLSGTTLWASVSENQWVIRHQFPPADAASRRYVYSNLLALDNTVLMVRQPNGNWLQSADGGHTWENPTNSFQTLNKELAQQTLANGSPRYGETRCRIQASPASAQVLVATCVWDNGSLPSRTCLHHSADGGNNWLPSLDLTTNSVIKCQSVGLPGTWAPSALVMDKVNPKQMLIAWMAGGVFRSEDAGQSWTSSDQGLRFRYQHEEALDFIALAEPLPIRAVLYRDLGLLDQLLADGASINEPGNQLSGVLDAELTAMEDKSLGKPNPSLWKELRARGVGANPPEGRRSNLLKRALELQAPEIVYDLIAMGYDWGRTAPEFKVGDSISTEIEGIISSADPGDRQVLESIVKAYIHAGKFPAADIAIREMLENKETRKAIEILRATTTKIALDKQSTPARVDRLELAMLLMDANEHKWAKRLFLAAKQVKPLVFNDDNRVWLRGLGTRAMPRRLPGM